MPQFRIGYNGRLTRKSDYAVSIENLPIAAGRGTEGLDESIEYYTVKAGKDTPIDEVPEPIRAKVEAIRSGAQMPQDEDDFSILDSIIRSDQGKES